MRRRLRKLVEPRTWTRQDWIFVARTFLFSIVAAVLFAAVYVHVVEDGCDGRCFPFQGRLDDDLRCECADLGGDFHREGGW